VGDHANHYEKTFILAERNLDKWLLDQCFATSMTVKTGTPVGLNRPRYAGDHANHYEKTFGRKDLG
jgi:hypothetical protein